MHVKLFASGDVEIVETARAAWSTTPDAAVPGQPSSASSCASSRRKKGSRRSRRGWTPWSRPPNRRTSRTQSRSSKADSWTRRRAAYYRRRCVIGQSLRDRVDSLHKVRNDQRRYGHLLLEMRELPRVDGRSRRPVSGRRCRDCRRRFHARPTSSRTSRPDACASTRRAGRPATARSTGAADPRWVDICGSNAPAASARSKRDCPDGTVRRIGASAAATLRAIGATSCRGTGAIARRRGTG